jgi:hypothetical protein
MQPGGPGPGLDVLSECPAHRDHGGASSFVTQRHLPRALCNPFPPFVCMCFWQSERSLSQRCLTVEFRIPCCEIAACILKLYALCVASLVCLSFHGITTCTPFVSRVVGEDSASTTGVKVRWRGGAALLVQTATISASAPNKGEGGGGYYWNFPASCQ